MFINIYSFFFQRHPEGVAQINFKEPDAADACVTLLHNRWFGQRRIIAEIWDGKTKYKSVQIKITMDNKTYYLYILYIFTI